MKVFIVEDDLHSLELYKEYLRQDSPEVEIVGQATNLQQARAFFMEQQPDLALLDIRMDEDKGTTFDLLRELQPTGRLNFDFIFITSHGIQEYMLQAIELSALKYLTKPVNRAEFRQAIEKALERKDDRETLARQVDMLLAQTRRATPASSGRMAIPLLKGLIEMADLNDILYIHSFQQGTMAQVFLENRDAPLNSIRPIGKFRQILTPGQGFFPIHESTLINLNKLQRYHHGEKTATMTDGASLYASKRGGRALRQYLLGEGQENREEEQPLLRRLWKALRRKG
ncbi:MAG: response regulator transcription factor [Lewinellaceae bacterium]|nr:response regulator transcription factor [Phaeodactylibacter sp.]MCB9350407.1 response regulator transcription factor [Lewinellaceae bacterium]